MPREARPYRTPVAKTMAFPNRVVMEKLRNTGNRAILKFRGAAKKTKKISKSYWVHAVHKKKAHTQKYVQELMQC